MGETSGIVLMPDKVDLTIYFVQLNITEYKNKNKIQKPQASVIATIKKILCTSWFLYGKLLWPICQQPQIFPGQGYLKPYK